MTTLNGSVGKNGRNIFQDVKTVQRLLNQNLPLLAPCLRLVEDALPGPQPLNAILEFQSRVVKLPTPAGWVIPPRRARLEIGDLDVEAKESRQLNIKPR